MTSQPFLEQLVTILCNIVLSATLVFGQALIRRRHRTLDRWGRLLKLKGKMLDEHERLITEIANARSRRRNDHAN